MECVVLTALDGTTPPLPRATHHDINTTQQTASITVASKLINERQ